VTAWNPLYDLWLSLADDDGEIDPFQNVPATVTRIKGTDLHSVEFPQSDLSMLDIRESSKRLIRVSEARAWACRVYAWSIPSTEVITALATMFADCGIVDPLAGTGYWARVLSDVGLPVTATDLFIPQIGASPAGYDNCDAIGGNPYHRDIDPWFPVLKADAASSATVNHEKALLLSWPPYNDDTGAKALEAYHAADGRDVIYVGEGNGGCTGDDRMHALLGDGYCSSYDDDHTDCICTVEQLFKEITSMPVPQWWGIHDRLTIYRRVS